MSRHARKRRYRRFRAWTKYLFGHYVCRRTVDLLKGPPLRYMMAPKPSFFVSDPDRFETMMRMPGVVHSVVIYGVVST